MTRQDIIQNILIAMIGGVAIQIIDLIIAQAVHIGLG